MLILSVEMNSLSPRKRKRDEQKGKKDGLMFYSKANHIGDKVGNTVQG